LKGQGHRTPENSRKMVHILLRPPLVCVSATAGRCGQQQTDYRNSVPEFPLMAIQGEPKKCSSTKITISQKCANNFIFVPNFAHMFTRQLYTSLLLCDVFT